MSDNNKILEKSIKNLRENLDSLSMISPEKIVPPPANAFCEKNGKILKNL